MSRHDSDHDMDATVERVLGYARRVAVVGASRDPSADAHRIPAELQERGFDILPITPNADELFGVPTRPSLDALTDDDRAGGIDVVDVFRPAGEAPAIARQAVAIGARALWLQLEITSDEARAIAEASGLDFVQDRCMGREALRRNIMRSSPPASA
jgi:uncharacterized protein